MSATPMKDYRIEPERFGVVRKSGPTLRYANQVLMAGVASTGSVGTFIDRVARYLVTEDQVEPPSILAESSEAPLWLDDVYSKVAGDQPDDAIDILFDHVDDMLLAGRFLECDDVLMTIDPKGLDTNLLVAALSITKAAADRLPSRPRFVQRVAHRLEELAPERLESLLDGLR